MATKIAIVRLAPGELAYYDSQSRIHLSLSNKEAVVYSDMNHSKIKQAIRDGRLELVSGALVPVTGSFNHKDDNEFLDKIKTPELIQPVKQQVEEVVKEEPKKETVEEAVYINKNEEVKTEETKKSKKKNTGKKKK